MCLFYFSEPVSVCRGALRPGVPGRGGLHAGTSRTRRPPGDRTEQMQREAQRRSLLQNPSGGKTGASHHRAASTLKPPTNTTITSTRRLKQEAVGPLASASGWLQKGVKYLATSIFCIQSVYGATVECCKQMSIRTTACADLVVLRVVFSWDTWVLHSCLIPSLTTDLHTPWWRRPLSGG